MTSLLASCRRMSPLWAAALLSILSSVIVLSGSNGVNADAVQYLIASDTFIAKGWNAAEQIYSRPFYPAVIGSLAQLFDISTYTSARLLNVLLLALLSSAFVLTVKRLSGDQRAQWLGAFVILALPTLADYRDYIIRDFGYWAFVLLGFCALLRYQQLAHIKDALLWFGFMGIAALFRPEAALLLAAVPAFLIFPFSKQDSYLRLKQTFKLYTVLLLPAIGIIVFTLLFRLTMAESFIHAITTTIGESWDELTQSLPELQKNIETLILNRHSEEYATLSIAMIFLGIFVASLGSALSPMFFLGFVYCWKKGSLHWPKSAYYWGMILCSGSILVLFLISKQFIQSRYMLLLALLLLVPLCLALNRELAHPKHHKAKTRTVFAILSLLILDNHISLGNSDQHIQESLAWINQYTEEGDWVYTNEHQLAYFSKRVFYWSDINYAKRHALPQQTQKANGYNLIALELGRKDNHIAELLEDNLDEHFKKVASFSNYRGDQVLIWRSSNAESFRHTEEWQTKQKNSFQNPN